jgi:hypothetical protein
MSRINQRLDSISAFLQRKEHKIGPLPEIKPSLAPEQSPGVLVIKYPILKDGIAQLAHRILFSRNLAYRVTDLARSLPGYELIAAYRTHDLAQAKRVYRALCTQFRGKRLTLDWFSLRDEDISFLKDYQAKAKQAPIGALKGMAKEIIWRCLCLVAARLGRFFPLDALIAETCKTGLDIATVQGQIQVLVSEG